MTIVEETNSICSDKDEELEVKDKGPREEEDDDAEEEEEEEEEDDEEDDDDDDEEDDDDEFDPAVIQYELCKNFFMDEEGTNVSSHLGAIAKELRTLNKILLKKNK
jgi:hypothetical protein